MNPFKILQIDNTATQQDIIRATAQAMRDKVYPVKDIATAQKALMNPISKAAYEFLNFINIESLQEQINIKKLNKNEIVMKTKTKVLYHLIKF